MREGPSKKKKSEDDAKSEGSTRMDLSADDEAKKLRAEVASLKEQLTHALADAKVRLL